MENIYLTDRAINDSIDTMKILLIDADSTIPNLALMKLSAYHKSLGDDVELTKLNLPYYPNRKKTHHRIDTSGYERVYCSVIFTGNREYIHGEGIIFGGTGTEDIMKCLPDYIENLQPDYSIYPDNEFSYGFISRGCIRKCSFCFVPKKEGGIRQVNTIDQIAQHKKVKFMDNNFLALPNHIELLQELIDKKIHCQFNQGLDLRLLTKENSELLRKVHYLKEYIFAFDNRAYLPIIEEKLPLLYWRKPWQIKFFVYVHPDMPIEDTLFRVQWCRDHEILPYIMRDISCWGSELVFFYTDLAAWCNQVQFFKGKTFEEFLIKRYPKNTERVYKSLQIYVDKNSNK